MTLHTSGYVECRGEGTIWGTRHKVIIIFSLIVFIALGSNRNGKDLLVGHICTVVLMCVSHIAKQNGDTGTRLRPWVGPRCNSCITPR